jgi:hypothetical protein
MSGKSIPSKLQPKDAKIASEQMIKIFSRISTFVTELNSAFGSQFHFVELYNHLLLKTKLSKKQVIQQHIEAFRTFFNRNKEALITRDVSKIVSHRISYSEKVYIDVHALLTSSDIDKETSEAIWNHLLVISATIDPSSEAREILRGLPTADTNEGKFLGTFFDRIQQSMSTVDASPTDPMTAIGTLMQSGVINEMMGSINQGVNNGSLDIGKLFQMVQGMMGGFSSMAAANGAPPPMAGMDLGGMMGMLMGGMGGALPSGDSNSFTAALDAEKVQQSIERRIEAEAKLEMAKEDNMNASRAENVSVISASNKTQHEEKTDLPLSDK